MTERFGHYEISRGADGRAVEIPRSPSELTLLAFDTVSCHLIELHILKDVVQSEAKALAYEQIAAASNLHSRTFPRILECGEDDDTVFYASNLTDGELLENYIQRRGVLPTATVFSLVLQLLEDLIKLVPTQKLLAGVSLHGTHITLMEETFLQLCLPEYGFGRLDSEESADTQQRLVYETCLVIFLMLTGKSYAGDDCDRLPVLTGLPTGLRAILRTTLLNPHNAPASLVRLRDEVRDTLQTQARDLQGRNSRRHLVATDGMVPMSSLREILLHKLALSQLLKGRLTLDENAEQHRYPFVLRGNDPRTDRPLQVHLLPPRRIISNQHYDAVPLQMWRFDAEKHPNILRSSSVWESPDLTFVTEEAGTGFPLSRLITERVYLNPPEVLLVLRQVRRGIEQAHECGIARLDLHPSNLTLWLQGAVPNSREMEKLWQKRLDAWPKFLVMLRPHTTMRSLYEPHLVETSRREEDDENLRAEAFRNRSFAALAAYLLSGEQQLKDQFNLPDSVPDGIAAFVRDSIDPDRPALSPSEFMAGLEQWVAVPELESENGIALPQRRSPSPVARTLAPITSSEPVEHAGTISDFDEDQAVTDDEPDGAFTNFYGSTKSPVSLLRVPTINTPKSKGVPPRGRMGMVVWAIVFATMVIMLISFFTKVADRPPLSDVASPQGNESSGSAASDAQPATSERPQTPEEVRRALLPTDAEKRRLREDAPRESEPPRLPELERLAGSNGTADAFRQR